MFVCASLHSHLEVILMAIWAIHTEICNMKVSVRNQSRWTKCMTNKSQKYSQRMCDSTLLNHLHANAE